MGNHDKKTELVDKHGKNVVIDWGNEDGSEESYTGSELEKLRAELAKANARADEFEEKYNKACKAYYKLKDYAEELIESSWFDEKDDHIVLVRSDGSVVYEDGYEPEEEYDIITYCDVCSCKECPRYGDDCDGNGEEEDEYDEE